MNFMYKAVQPLKQISKILLDLFKNNPLRPIGISDALKNVKPGACDSIQPRESTFDKAAQPFKQISRVLLDLFASNTFRQQEVAVVAKCLKAETCSYIQPGESSTVKEYATHQPTSGYLQFLHNFWDHSKLTDGKVNSRMLFHGELIHYEGPRQASITLQEPPAKFDTLKWFPKLFPYYFKKIIVETNLTNLNMYRIQEYFVYLGGTNIKRLQNLRKMEFALDQIPMCAERKPIELSPKKSDPVFVENTGPLVYHELPNPSNFMTTPSQLKKIILAPTRFVNKSKGKLQQAFKSVTCEKIKRKCITNKDDDNYEIYLFVYHA